MFSRMFSYEELSMYVRLINKSFFASCTEILNGDFLRMQKRIENDITLWSSFVEKEDAVEVRAKYCVGRDIMEQAQLDYVVTLAVIWRYVYVSKPLCNIYCGKLMDLFEDLLNLFPHNRTLEMAQTIRLVARAFQDHFQDKTERPINLNWTISGCKLLDMLDCIREDVDSKKVIQEDIQLSKGYGTDAGKYNLSGAWYCSLNTNGKRAFNNHFRYISHCIRRLVTKRNLYGVYEIQRTRQMALFNESIFPSRSCSYSGFQHVGIVLFGCLNQGAYRSRIEEERNRLEERQTDEEDDMEVDNVFDISPVLPSPSLLINVTLRCPIEMAPKKILCGLNIRDYTMRSREEILLSEVEFELKMDVFCTASTSARLPSTSSWTCT